MGLQIYKLVEIPSSERRELQYNVHCSPEKGVSCPRMTARERHLPKSAMPSNTFARLRGRSTEQIQEHSKS